MFETFNTLILADSSDLFPEMNKIDKAALYILLLTGWAGSGYYLSQHNAETIIKLVEEHDDIEGLLYRVLAIINKIKPTPIAFADVVGKDLTPFYNQIKR